MRLKVAPVLSLTLYETQERGGKDSGKDRRELTTWLEEHVLINYMATAFEPGVLSKQALIEPKPPHPLHSPQDSLLEFPRWIPLSVLPSPPLLWSAARSRGSAAGRRAPAQAPPDAK